MKPLVPFAAGGPHLLKLTLIIVGLGIVLSGCGQSSAQVLPTASPVKTSSTSPSAARASAALPSPVATTRVNIQGFAFLPQVISVPAGSTVTWTNMDLDDHTVTANDGTFNSDAVGSGQTFSSKLAKPGTYDYHCLIHPYMHGRVVVTAP
jgi:plastocyanin